ncbi:isoprenylcysteine carboxylmethyltransferase family protein [Candidatus Daviesbacteria bacterium]|nr:isoprenylcysteine carboxylmethyltransferase family protein [Candidatus Daviesbacteria bacterium]
MEYDYGNWLLVLFNIVLFLYFIKSAFKPRTKTDWTTFRYFGAFIVALFAEMYGFPLTIYLLTSFFGNKLGLDFTHNNGHILNTLFGLKGDPHFNILHIASYALIIGGLVLLGRAWEVLYKAVKQNKLATDSVYKYIRHPQYLAFILIILGFLVQWPTLITLIMAPILIFRYIKLARTEEKEMLKKFGSAYQVYKNEVPGFFPSIKHLLGDVIQKITISKDLKAGEHYEKQSHIVPHSQN